MGRYNVLKALAALAFAERVCELTTHSSAVDSCPGYTATNVITQGPNLTANLILAGPACNAYGPDIEQLLLEVTYETGTTLKQCIGA